MYQNKGTIDAIATSNGGSGFASAFYWSSTENLTNFAWMQFFGSGNQNYGNKTNSNSVRAIRAF